MSGAAGRVGAVAANTFREAVRSRALYLILGFAILMIASSRLLSMLTVGEEDKILKDLGLAAIQIFGVATALFVGIGLIFHEVERRTVQAMIALPLRREEFLVGKYVGLALVLATNLALMSAGLVLVLLARGAFDVRLAVAIGSTLLELWLVAALAVFFSSYSTPLLSAVLTGALWLIGHLSWSFDLLADKVGPGAGAQAARALKWLLPNLASLDVRAEVVHGLPLDPGRLLWASAYVAGYALLLVAAGCLAFRRRSFT